MRQMHKHFQQPFREELERLHKTHVTIPLRVDETSEWYNSFVFMEKLCLNAAKLNQSFITLVHWALTVNEILPKTANVKYITLIDANSGYKTFNYMRNHFTL